MKRVLHILSSLERSGMEKMLLSSSLEWARLGFACDVVASADEVGSLADQMREAGYGVFHLPFRSKYRYLPRLRFIPEYFALCRSSYEVVHIHTEAAVPVFALLARLAGVPIVALTPHNTFYFSGVLRLRKTMERWLVRLIGGRYGMISDGVEKCERENFGNQGVRTWNWFDSSHFRPPSAEERTRAREALNLRPGNFAIVSVGNCNAVKNHGELLRAVEQLPASIEPIYLHVGREEAGEPERKLVAELRIAERVRFLGTQDDVRRMLWSADVFAMPSLREGLSIAAIEAIGSGTPALMSRIDGLAEIADVAESVMLTGTDAESIAQGLMTLAEMSAEERQRRARQDSARIHERFAMETGVRSIVEGLYRLEPSTGLFAREGTAH